MKNWSVAQLNKEAAQSLAKDFSLPPVAAMLLQIRGVEQPEEVMQFLGDDADFSDPFLMADMDKAVGRIERAIEQFEKICVYGDYDADGVTSTALLYSYLEGRGADVSYYIPSRESEGYGMNMAAVEKMHEQGVQLIITVDNGISAVNEIAYANTLGIDTVVTDHHKPPEALPDACALLDPHRLDCESPCKELCGVGVAFKLVMALEDGDLDVDELLFQYADLAALGTIGDVVPLTGENRIFVKHGLSLLRDSSREGICAMLEEAAIIPSKLSAGKVAFTLVPRINACGRLALSQKSVQLLLTNDSERARETARELGRDNAERQQIERDILKIIEEEMTRSPAVRRDRVIVVDGEGWHPGVIGIVAARIKELYGKPALVLSRDGDIAKGSGRSIKGFSLIDAIAACSEYLTYFGGHPMAAGLTMPSNQIGAFRQAINEYAKNQGEMPQPTLDIDLKLNPAFLSADIVSQTGLLEPYGAGNPSPLFGLYNMVLKAVKPVGANKHLRLTFSRGETSVTAMRFSCTPEEFPYKPGDVLDLAVTTDLNEYNGTVSLSVIIRDMKLSTADNGKMIADGCLFEALIRGESLTQQQREYIRPVREEFAYVYRFLKTVQTWGYGLDVLCCRLQSESIHYGKLLVVLTAMRELSLIEFEEGADTACHISVLPAGGKVDLSAAPIIMRIDEMQ